jgi:polysaccharide export outer membrane protein
MAAKQIVRFGLVAALVAGCVAVGAAQQSSPKISPRDKVTIEVAGIVPKAVFNVDSDGMISFPPLEKPVKAAGLTVHDLEALLSNQLFDEQWLTVHAKVSAELEQLKNKRVIVDGAVRSPGMVEFAGELTVREALLQVGSTTIDAGDIARITRAGVGTAASGAASPDPLVVEVNLRDLLSGSKAAKNVVLQDGDTLYVAKAEQVYIDGYVNRPGAYPVQSGMTLKQVITLAGGVAERGSKGRIEILRGGKKVDKVNYEKTTVMPGDTITVKARIL